MARGSIHSVKTIFLLADQAVLAAEIYAEKQVQQAELILIVFGAVFLLLAALLAWIQSRRQKVLIQAEESNRVESEKLEQMSQDLRAPMDQVSELMYIADPITYELLYINEAGRKNLWYYRAIRTEVLHSSTGKRRSL